MLTVRRDCASASGTVARLLEPSAAAPLLRANRAEAVYHIGALGQPYDRCSTWWVHYPRARPEEPAVPDAAVLLFGAAEPPLVFACGSSGGVAAVFDQVRLPGSPVYLAIPERHLWDVSRRFTYEEPAAMRRMQAHRSAFRPDAACCWRPTRLGPPNARRISALLARSDDLQLDEHQLGLGRYYGVEHGGDLIGVAGCHFLRPELETALIGNVMTHPAWRGRGVARACLTALLTAMFEDVPRVFLSVAERNVGAAKLYERMGFSTRGRFIEGVAHPLAGNTGSRIAV